MSVGLLIADNVYAEHVSSVCEISIVGMPVIMSKKLFTNVHFHELPDAEERMNDLRARDMEIASLSTNFQMRSRINSLEREVSVLTSIHDTWVLTRFNRLYFNLTRLAKLTRRILSSKS